MVARESYEVTFTRPPGFVFKPGQYTQVALPALSVPDPKGNSRQFSIASNPDNHSEVSVVFRARGSGFKQSLLALESGSAVMLERAAGSFLLPTESIRPLAFAAGGVGISPFMSYFRFLRTKPLSHSLALFYGNQSPESAAFLDELRGFAKSHPQMRLHEQYAPPTPELFAQFAKRVPEAAWFVVGPPGMVATTIYGLEAGGVLPRAIVRESFDGYL